MWVYWATFNSPEENYCKIFFHIEELSSSIFTLKWPMELYLCCCNSIIFELLPQYDFYLYFINSILNNQTGPNSSLCFPNLNLHYNFFPPKGRILIDRKGLASIHTIRQWVRLIFKAVVYSGKYCLLRLTESCLLWVKNINPCITT